MKWILALGGLASLGVVLGWWFRAETEESVWRTAYLQRRWTTDEPTRLDVLRQIERQKDPYH